MGARKVELPDGAFVTSRRAAAMLGLPEKKFLRMAGHVGDQPELIIPGVRDWLRPVRIGRQVMWDRDDIVALAQVLKKMRDNSEKSSAFQERPA